MHTFPIPQMTRELAVARSGLDRMPSRQLPRGALTISGESFHWNKTPDRDASGEHDRRKRILSTCPPSDRRRVQRLLQDMERVLPDDSLGLVYRLARSRLQGELALMRGDTKTALTAFRKADALDAPLSAREYLARALLAAASRESKMSAALKQEALRIYARTALRPASVWRQAWYYPPGFVSDQMASYLALAKSLGQDDDDARDIAKAFQKLPQYSDIRNYSAAYRHFHQRRTLTIRNQLRRPLWQTIPSSHTEEFPIPPIRHPTSFR